MRLQHLMTQLILLSFLSKYIITLKKVVFTCYEGQTHFVPLVILYGQGEIVDLSGFNVRGLKHLKIGFQRF